MWTIFVNGERMGELRNLLDVGKLLVEYTKMYERLNPNEVIDHVSLEWNDKEGVTQD